MPIQNKRAIFFDAGFTLLEPTLPIHQVYWEKATQLGVRLDFEDFCSHMKEQWLCRMQSLRSGEREWHSSDELEKQGWWDFTHQLSQPFPDLLHRHEQWLADLADHFDRADAWRIRPAVVELLDQLRDRQVAIAVVSNWHTALHGILEGHGLADRFDFVLTSAEVGRKKPHALMFQEALRKSAVSAEDAVHVGDSWEEDVEGAMSVGISAIYLGALPTTQVRGNVTAVACLSELLDSLAQ